MTVTQSHDEALWAAVGEPSRQRLLDVLLARGEATPSALAEELPFTRQAVSKHLAVLGRAGLVEGRRQGREVRYVVRPERLDAAFAGDGAPCDAVGPAPTGDQGNRRSRPPRPTNRSQVERGPKMSTPTIGTRDGHLSARLRLLDTATAAALLATLGLGAACWVVAVRQMNGMDMGVATALGSFGFFIAVWVSMMAAMMLPGAAPAVLRRARAGGGVRVVPLFVGSYLGVWTIVGVAVYALYRPHGTVATGVVAIAAGLYEFTPLKRHFRRRCRESVRSGVEFGRYCVGSSIGLMAVFVALSVMSITWMSVIAVLVLTQKLLPAKPVLDVPLALAIVGFGVLILIAPASVPGLTPAM